MAGVQIEIFGIIAAFLINAASLPQIIKTARTKLVRDISLLYWLIVCAGQSLWAVYGILINGIALFASCVVACSLCLTMIALILRYR
jgi:MtN3 and saliva related transmembrane protein